MVNKKHLYSIYKVFLKQLSFRNVDALKEIVGTKNVINYRCVRHLKYSGRAKICLQVETNVFN